MSVPGWVEAILGLLFLVYFGVFLWIRHSVLRFAEQAEASIGRFVASEGGTITGVWAAGVGGKAFGIYDVVLLDPEGRERRGTCRVWFKVKWMSPPT